jgi:CBS domain-containing protein
MHGEANGRGQILYPIVEADGRLLGVATRNQLLGLLKKHVFLGRHGAGGADPALRELANGGAAVAYPDEPLRVVAYRMAERGLTRFPVVERETGRLIGLLSLADLLKARALNLDAEQRREPVLRPLHLFFPRSRGEAPVES